MEENGEKWRKKKKWRKMEKNEVKWRKQQWSNPIQFEGIKFAHRRGGNKRFLLKLRNQNTLTKLLNYLSYQIIKLSNLSNYQINLLAI